MNVQPGSLENGGSGRPVPVVSVGNLALGGRGKTPTAALVATLLVEAGERPAIISRGYKRQIVEDGAVIVSDGTRQLADVARGGDEPVMMARRVPGAAVVVCDVRAIGAALAETAIGVTVHVLDDGFQHRSLRRDIDLVIVTPEDLVDRRLPFGRLRSSTKTLRDAAAVIVDGVRSADVDHRLGTLIDRQRTAVFALDRRAGSLQWIERPDGGGGEPAPSGTRVLAIAGIARPERFVATLRLAGYDVADVVSFPDHHSFSARDVERMRTRLHASAAVLAVTTEKDAMRLLPRRPFGFPLAIQPLDVAIRPEGEFRNWLLHRISEARACER